MSFSVKAGPSTPPESALGHLHQALPSPVVHTHISPQLLPQSSFSLSNFSLNDEYTSASALISSSVASTVTGMPTPSISNTTPSLSTRRPGTDPAKYKTTICRNWEQTGVCNFRGCTFAHGVEELRAPVRSERHTPHLHFQRMSQGSTPPQMPSQLALSSVSAANNTSSNSNMNNNNSNSTSSVLMSAIASNTGIANNNNNTTNTIANSTSHTSYHNSYSNSNTTNNNNNINNNNNNSNGGGSYSGGGGGNHNSSNNDIGSTSSISGSSSNSNLQRLEQLMEMLYVEIRRQEALVVVHMEANRTLEAMLHREQALHAQTQGLLEEKKMECHQLLQIINEQELHLQHMCHVGDSSKTNITTHAMPNISTSVGRLSTSEESTSHSHQHYRHHYHRQEREGKQEHEPPQEQEEEEEEEEEEKLEEEEEELEEACELVQDVQALETAKQQHEEQEQQQEQELYWKEHLSSRQHEVEEIHEEQEQSHEQYLYESRQTNEHANIIEKDESRMHSCRGKREKKLINENEDMLAMIEQTAQLVQQMHDMSNETNDTSEEETKHKFYQEASTAEVSNLKDDSAHDEEKNLEELLVTLQKEEETAANEDKQEKKRTTMSTKNVFEMEEHLLIQIEE